MGERLEILADKLTAPVPQFPITTGMNVAWKDGDGNQRTGILTEIYFQKGLWHSEVTYQGRYKLNFHLTSNEGWHPAREHVLHVVGSSNRGAQSWLSSDMSYRARPFLMHGEIYELDVVQDPSWRETLSSLLTFEMAPNRTKRVAARVLTQGSLSPNSTVFLADESNEVYTANLKSFIKQLFAYSASLIIKPAPKSGAPNVPGQYS